MKMIFDIPLKHFIRKKTSFKFIVYLMYLIYNIETRFIKYAMNFESAF
jgi:hypothetical protein